MTSRLVVRLLRWWEGVARSEGGRGLRGIICKLGKTEQPFRRVAAFGSSAPSPTKGEGKSASGKARACKCEADKETAGAECSESWRQTRRDRRKRRQRRPHGVPAHAAPPRHCRRGGAARARRSSTRGIRHAKLR